MGSTEWVGERVEDGRRDLCLLRRGLGRLVGIEEEKWRIVEVEAGRLVARIGRPGIEGVGRLIERGLRSLVGRIAVVVVGGVAG